MQVLVKERWMSKASKGIPEPPQPPEYERKLKFYPYQLIGIPLLFLIPILALFGVFGETSTVIQSEANGIELEIHYANRVLFQGLDGTEIHVRNATETVIPALTISIEKAFLDNYSDIAFTPDVEEINDVAYILELSDVQPSETRIVTYDSRGKIIGAHRGTVTASYEGDGPSVILETFIIP
jgi:hypothetical protein